MEKIQPATAEEIETWRKGYCAVRNLGGCATGYHDALQALRLIATIDALTAGLTGDDRPSSLPTFERRAFKELVAEVTARAEAAEADAAALRQRMEAQAAIIELVAHHAWREDPPNAVRKRTDSERLSVIKYCPGIRAVLTQEPTP